MRDKSKGYSMRRAEMSSITSQTAWRTAWGCSSLDIMAAFRKHAIPERRTYWRVMGRFIHNMQIWIVSLNMSAKSEYKWLNKVNYKYIFFNHILYDLIVIQINTMQSALFSLIHRPKWYHKLAVVDKVHRSSTWVKVQIRIIKYYSSKSKSTAFSILLEWKYKSTQFFMYLSKKVLIDRFILQFYIDYFI